MALADDAPAEGRTACFVLVHGAAHGGWCWADVARRLRASGHEVHTPTLTGLGERSHLLAFDPGLPTFIEDVSAVLRFEDLEDVILVGHSHAGSVISGVADRMPQRLRHLVYLDALVLLPGESSAGRDPAKIERYRQQAVCVDGVMAVPPGPPERYGITDPRLAGRTSRRLTPQPLRPYDDLLQLERLPAHGVQATYIACTAPALAGLERSREVARELGWQRHDLQTGHDAMLLAPRALATLLDAIAAHPDPRERDDA